MTCWSFVWAQPCFNKQVPVRVCEHTCVFKMGQGFWFYLILSPGSFFLFSFDLFLYWRMIALQNFVVFCQTSTWISRAAAAKSLQSCPTLYDPIDGSPPGSPVPGILQARTLEWVAISFSNAWKWKVKVKSLSRVRLFATPWTAAYQAALSVGFSRQEYWSGVPLPSPESAIGIHIYPPFWTSLPSPPASHPHRFIQSPCLNFLSHTANSRWLSMLHMVI